MAIDFYIVDLPIIKRHISEPPKTIAKNKTQLVEQNGKLFLHGNGCKVNPNCLECPRPTCRYDRKTKHESQ